MLDRAHEAPRYSVAEAAHHLHLPRATLRSWVLGRRYRTLAGPRQWLPVIELPDRDDRRLSYSNLVEAHVLRALRAEHGLRVKEVRKAIDLASRRYSIRRLLLSEQL